MSRAKLVAPVVLFRMTSDQFSRLPESDQFDLELLAGNVIVSAKPTPPHQYFGGKLFNTLDDWGTAHSLGRALPDVSVRLARRWMPAADIVFVRTEHLGRIKRKRVVGPVDLAVEILSPSTKKIDRQIKFVAYARYGIPWYWIIDLEQRRVEEYELAGRVYANLIECGFDQPFSPRLFPGLNLNLAAMEW